MAVESKHNPLSCPVCERETNHEFRGDSLCSGHRLALENIQRHYREWVRAYGSLAKREYLQLLVKNPGSGKWVTEVAWYLVELNETERLG